jgi:hypothetical protein
MQAASPKCFDKLARDPRTADPADPNKPETVMGRVQVCSWVIPYDPDQENDEVMDYGVIWVQSSIDPRNGYCANLANTKIRLPYGEGRVTGRSPHRSLIVSQPREKNVALAVNAAGHGPTGTVFNHYRLHPKTLEIAYERVKKGRVYINRWRGVAGEHKHLAFATGLKLSWLAKEGAPTFLPRLRYNFVVPNDETKKACG